MEILIEKKRPVRFKNRVKKILRYCIVILPYLTFRLLNMCIKLHGKTEKTCYKLMQKYKLLSNFNK